MKLLKRSVCCGMVKTISSLTHDLIMRRLFTLLLLLLSLLGCDQFVENQDSALEDTYWSIEGAEEGFFLELSGFDCQWRQPSPPTVPARLELRFWPRTTVPTLEQYAGLLGKDFSEITGPPLRITLFAGVARERTYTAFPITDTSPRARSFDANLETPPSALVTDPFNYDGSAFLALEGVKIMYERGHLIESKSVEGSFFHEVFIHHLRIPEQQIALPNGETWTVGGYLSDARIACPVNEFVSVE